MDESADELYLQHKDLIKTLVNSIVINNPGVVSTEDLQQAGALALMVAMKSYDPSLGSFKSYIRKCVRNALLEQANTFNGVFTVDEKVRRQANKVAKLRKQGIADDEIMGRLGIGTQATFHALLNLLDTPVGIEHIDLSITDDYLDLGSIVRVLDEIGLDEVELKLVNLMISDHSMSDLETEMALSRSQLYKLRASIRDKILNWGKQ